MAYAAMNMAAAAVANQPHAATVTPDCICQEADQLARGGVHACGVAHLGSVPGSKARTVVHDGEAPRTVQRECR
jgi:hypothetical protein